MAGQAIDPRSFTFSGVTLVNMAAPSQLKVLSVPGRVVGTVAAP